jgi:hypothetical protein
MEGTAVTVVELYYTVSTTDYKNITTNRDKFTVNHGGIIKTESGTRLEISNSSIQTSTYRGMFPKLDSGGYLYFWIYAEDSAGFKRTTNPPFQAKIIDIDRSYSLLRIISISFVLLTALGIVLIMIFFTKVQNSKVRDKTRLYRVGSLGNTEFMSEKDKPKEPNPHLIYIVIGVIVAVCIALIIISFATGSYMDIVTHLKEGK